MTSIIVTPTASAGMSSTAIIIAVISLVGTVGAAIVAAYTTFSSTLLKRRAAAKSILDQYQDPFLLATLALRRQLHSLLLSHTDPNDDQAIAGTVTEDYTVIYTAYLVGQFFAWLYILRTESQFLSIERSRKTIRALTDTIFDVEEAWSVEEGGQFKLWRGQQSGIGELLTVDNGGQRCCMGYATFRDRWYSHPDFNQWFGDFKHNARGGSKRLKAV